MLEKSRPIGTECITISMGRVVYFLWIQDGLSTVPWQPCDRIPLRRDVGQ